MQNTVAARQRATKQNPPAVVTDTNSRCESAVPGVAAAAASARPRRSEGSACATAGAAAGACDTRVERGDGGSKLLVDAFTVPASISSCSA